MKFKTPLIKATLIRRYKRFLADVELDGKTVVAHCPNTGSMKTCGDPGDTVYLSFDPSPKRKLAYTWELTEKEDGLVCVNTQRPNQIVGEALRLGQIPFLSAYKNIKAEAKYGSSRFDFFLSAPGLPNVWLEVKNTTLLEDGVLYFPDAVSDRGLKHLEMLTKIALETKDICVMFYLVNRPGGRVFKPAFHIDPAYCRGFITAQGAGVRMLAYRSLVDLNEVVVNHLSSLDVF